MKVVLKDHGKILHTAGAHHLFPVRGPEGINDVRFASHGALEGAKPIGWNEFFPALERADLCVVADSDEGTLSVVPSSQGAGAPAADHADAADHAVASAH